MLRRRRREPEDFQISLQFSDGRQAISGRPRGDSSPQGRSCNRAVGGTSHSQLFRWWVWPLPPTGPLEFDQFPCQWPVYGIGETRVGIDGQVILDAARRSVQLWPEDDPGAAAEAGRNIHGMILGDSRGAVLTATVTATAGSSRNHLPAAIGRSSRGPCSQMLRSRRPR